MSADIHEEQVLGKAYDAHIGGFLPTSGRIAIPPI
jgi:hypothetical protein